MPPDVVFIVSEHVRRPELQYALRSWDLVPHGAVWFVGGRPGWVRNVRHVPFRDHQDKWQNIADKAKSLASLDGLAEEFYYTEDDYFILRPFDRIPDHSHPQTLNEQLAGRETRRKGRQLGGWWGYLQSTRDTLHAHGITDPVSFDVHIPMLWEKSKIPVHMDTGRPMSWRSLVGNTRKTVPVPVPDVKAGSSRRKAAVVASDVGFLSSSEGTFRKLVEPVVAALFPEPCRYEQEYYMDFEPESPYDHAPRLDAKKQRIVARRVRRNKPDRVQYEDGTWVDVATIDEKTAEKPDTTTVGDPVCDVCGFVAKTAGGLATHQRSHESED
jgi:hypothetical protein